MKRAAIILACILFAFSLAACSGGQSVYTQQVPSDDKVSSSGSQISSNSNVSSANNPVNPDYSLFNVVNIETDGRTFDHLQGVEEDANVIVEGIVKKGLGQKVFTDGDHGNTNWEVDLTKVYKGNLKVGDKIKFEQPFYLKKYNDGTTALISHTEQKPVKLNQKYLLFLYYDENTEGYSVVGDFEGIFASPPSEELKVKRLAGTITPKDLNMYGHEPLPQLPQVYKEVIQKYFK